MYQKHPQLIHKEWNNVKIKISPQIYLNSGIGQYVDTEIPSE